MRAEIVRLVCSLCLVGGAFLGGVYVGWRRWGIGREPDHAGLRFTTTEEPAEPAGEPRRDLFAPASAGFDGSFDGDFDAAAIDLRLDPSALPRHTASAPERSLPRAALVADEIVTYRRVHDPRRAD